eukprot:comp4345_c0_seq1/m.2873 comp4345_c0_seq1/g.2873  ORF comp4345_c0_seq1/g.2873 comp4345_c0_seq1/m.2873 type:complete len:274 (-) comp4345_c0_seq1:79-900(-)
MSINGTDPTMDTAKCAANGLNTSCACDPLERDQAAKAIDGSTFYMRPLPSSLVPFSSSEGRQRLREADNARFAESFYPLIEQFTTQAEPAFCGLSSLVMVLNGFGLDPGKVWKPPWRFYTEEHLNCCLTLEDVKQRGIAMPQLACLARCNSLDCEELYTDKIDIDLFRERITHTVSHNEAFAVVSYSRQSLGQTGIGHFSPVAAYHKATDSVLILDVARFKYPPYWATISELYKATLPVDTETNRSRGLMIFQRAKKLGAPDPAKVRRTPSPL